MKNLFLFFQLFIGLTLFGQNQNSLFAKYGNGSYKTYKTETSYNYNNQKHVKFIEVSKPWPVSLEMSSTNDFEGNTMISKVIISRQGVIKENFLPDLPENPVYFAFKDFRISVIDDKIYYYEWNNDNATIIYLLTKSSVASYDAEVEKVNQYIRNSFKNQQGAKGKIAEVKKENDQRLAEENSLKGKTIKSIEIVMVDVPKELGNKSTVKFGVKASDTNGKVYSTTNLGGHTLWDDFKITTSDGTHVDDAIEIHEDASKITNDELKFTVASKYTPGVTSQKIIPINYAFSTFLINHNGKSIHEIAQQSMVPGAVTNAGSGRSLELKIQKTTTKNTNMPIFKVEIIDVVSGKTINRYKFSQNTVINLYANGGEASRGTDRKKTGSRGAEKAGDGTNGGNGGNITVSKSSDANIALNIFNKGAKGGRGGEGISISYNGNPGRDGADGKITNKTFSENLNW